MRRLLRSGIEYIVPIAILAVWWVWSAFSSSFYAPPLSEILRTFVDVWTSERIGTDLLPSLGRFALGYGLVVVVGVAGGIVIGRSTILRWSLTPTIDYLRSLPNVILIPAAIVVIGRGTEMIVSMILIGAVWPVFLNTVDAVRGVDPVLRDVSHAYRIGRVSTLRYIIFPSILPQVFAGMRTSLSMAIIALVVSEMLTSSNGVGFFVVEAQRSFAIPEMWAGVFMLGLFGYGLNRVFLLVERRVLFWHRGLDETSA